MSRFAPLTPETMTPAQARVAESIAGTRGGNGARGPFNMWLRVPELADRLQQVGAYIRYEAKVGQKLVEFAICVTARAWNAPYEWHAHAPLAVKAGLNPAHLAAVAADTVPDGLDPAEAITHRVASALAADGALADDVFEAAQAILGEAGLVEIVLACGYYTAVAFTLNVARVALPEGGVAWAIPSGA